MRTESSPTLHPPSRSRRGSDPLPPYQRWHAIHAERPSGRPSLTETAGLVTLRHYATTAKTGFWQTILYPECPPVRGRPRLGGAGSLHAGISFYSAPQG